MRRNSRYLALIFAFGVPLLIAFWYLPGLNSDNGSSATRVVEEQGQRLYQEWGCGTCHGDDGNGSPKGPNLRGISFYWKRALLIKYLKNPGEFREYDPRLRDLSRRYFPISMPSPEGLTERQRVLLADYLLQLNKVSQ